MEGKQKAPNFTTLISRNKPQQKALFFSSFLYFGLVAFPNKRREEEDKIVRVSSTGMGPRGF